MTIRRMQSAVAFAVFAVFLVCSVSSAQVVINKPIPPVASIQINLADASRQPIPRTLFGSFLEPIGNSTYNGLWAEILENPSFEAGLWSPAGIREMLSQRPELQRSSDLGVPLPWEPLDSTQGNRYEFRYGDAANSARSIAILGIPGKATGITQRVYLPAHRTLSYSGSLYARHLAGPAELTVMLRRRDDLTKVLAQAVINAPGAEWTKYPFKLELQPNTLYNLEPADFVIQVKDEERVLIDQVSLMPSDAIQGLDPDMVRMVQAMHTPLIRFGGNFTSGYHWRDGIGPIDKRVSMPNVAWGIPEYNTFGTDEFLNFCKLVNAEPQVALNLGSGTPEEAADWVSYVNQHWGNQQGGLLWELGNELWGTWNTGWPTKEELEPRTLAFSQAIRHADPKARLIATGQDPDTYREWNAAQLTAPAGTEDFLSTHFVVTTDQVALPNPSPRFLFEASLAMPVELERKLREMQEQINQSPHKDRVHIAFTEWLWYSNGRRPGAPRFDDVAGALTTGSMYNMLLRSSDHVPISDMTGVIEFAGVWKKRGRVFAAPAAYVFEMFSTADADHLVPVVVESGNYSVHHGVTRLPEIADVPYLDVTAAASKDNGTVTLFVVNRSMDRDIPTHIGLAGFQPGPRAEVTTLASDDLYAKNSEDSPTAVDLEKREVAAGANFRYQFPHASVTRIVFAPRKAH